MPRTPTSQPQTEAPPSPPPGGRDARGRFAPGNGGGPGNPFARRTAAFRRAVAETVSDETIVAVVQKLTEKALAGDLAAIKLLLAYTVGKPAAAVDPDTLDLDEVRHYGRESDALDDLHQALRTPGLEVLLDTARVVRPYLAGDVAEKLFAGIAELDSRDAAARKEEAVGSPEEEPGAAEVVDQSPAAAPSANGGNGSHSPAGQGSKRKPAPSANGANGRRALPSPAGSSERADKPGNGTRGPTSWKGGTNGHGRVRPVRPQGP